jgi:hypothetical protein
MYRITGHYPIVSVAGACSANRAAAKRMGLPGAGWWTAMPDPAAVRVTWINDIHADRRKCVPELGSRTITRRGCLYGPAGPAEQEALVTARMGLDRERGWSYRSLRRRRLPAGGGTL